MAGLHDHVPGQDDFCHFRYRVGDEVIHQTLAVVVELLHTFGLMKGELLATDFEPFRRLATARPSRGTGLGLPLTKALAEANHASLTIKSKEHEGTLVELVFPPARILAE